MRLTRFVATAAAATIAATGLVACSNDSSTDGASGDGDTTIKIGTTDADQQAWSVFSDLAAEEGITLEIIPFSDYAPVNEALAQGELDVNKFQHIKYLAEYNVGSGEDLKVVGSTEIYPLALFWKDHTSLDGIEGQDVAIPNDPSNQGRAINVLVQAGLVTLAEEDLTDPTPADIDTEASKVNVTPIDAAQTPTVFEEGRPSIINNSWLGRAGITPEEAVFEDDPNSTQAEPYINVFASRAEDISDPTLNKLVELWHSPEVTEAVAQDSEGTAVQVTRDQAELNDVLARLEEESK
ncbi:MetQ/NlpA family ABC transporter substrate-binding protein [Corynebacterium lubricantis]|uniref:MetQ/NlpA family ABC transporter substrate-binding protein n=1 Tax=Corynebacterium lubricantis TaxID=541095 RepID=UPI00036644B3|nr:MetQ/NlpA family ABC transporter substrate-binding protein [Corynebacterium lubricantis]